MAVDVASYGMHKIVEARRHTVPRPLPVSAVHTRSVSRGGSGCGSCPRFPTGYRGRQQGCGLASNPPARSFFCKQSRNVVWNQSVTFLWRARWLE